MTDENNNNEATQNPSSKPNAAAELLMANSKLIFGVLAGLLIAFGTYTGVESYKNQQEMAAQSKLFSIEKKIEFFEEGLRKDSKTRADASFEQDYKAFAGELETFIKANSNQKAALRASLTLANLYGEFSMPTEAANAMKLIEPKLKADMLNVLFYTQKLSRLIDVKSFDDATKLADKILAMKELDFTHALAKLKKAVALDAKGEALEAQTLYKQVASDYPEHPAGQTAKQYLRLSN